MRLPVRHSARRALQFNVTPLIDIVFLLIIFFLVASHFVRNENATAIELPLASKSASEDALAHRLTITILSDGSYSLAGEVTPKEVILQRIAELRSAADAKSREPEVRIRADRSGRYHPIREIIQHCARHNIQSFQFAVAVDES
jgi:biopolymer transport protein ExbD